MSRLPAAALLAVALTACRAHVALPPAPPPTAPIQHRLGYYQRYRPANNHGNAFGQLTLTSYGGWSMQPASSYLVLADGTLVSDPLDLIQMVGPDAPLAETARRADSAQTLASAFTWGGVAASVVGAVLMLTSFGNSYDGSLPTSFWAGLGLGLAGSISTSVGRWGFATSAATERAGAFNALDAALRSRLALCGDGEGLRDCNAAPAPPPAPTAPSASPWAVPPPLPPAPPLAPGVSIHRR